MKTSERLPANLERALVPAPVLHILSRLQDKGFQAYLVGGCVRDMVLGIQPKDYDVATGALPDDVQGMFDRVIPTGKQHGTVTVLAQGRSVEVTTFRSEGEYLDARRPSRVEFQTDIDGDLSRRDFTINAMAYDPIAKELRDPFSGQRDLRDRLVRCVGDPRARFSEDGLRSLRAVRFAAALGFQIDPLTAQAIPGSVPSVRKISVERIREEFCKLLLSARPGLGLELLRKTRLLEVFLPELLEGLGQAQGSAYALDVYGHALASVEACRADLPLRLGALLHDVAKPRTAVADSGTTGVEFPGHEIAGAALATQILDRLKFPRRLVEAVESLVLHHRLYRLETASDGDVRRFIAAVGEKNVETHFALAEANCRGRGTEVQRRLEDLRRFRARVDVILRAHPPLDARALAINGAEIMRILGVSPSPAVGEATRFLLERVLDDPELNSGDSLAAILRNWARSRGK